MFRVLCIFGSAARTFASLRRTADIDISFVSGWLLTAVTVILVTDIGTVDRKQ